MGVSGNQAMRNLLSRFRLAGVTVAAVLAAVTPSLGADAAADPPYYRLHETWQATLRCSREALRKWESSHPDPPAQAYGQVPGVALSPHFWGLGPLVPPKGEDAFSYAFPPESGVDLKRAYGEGVRWRARRRWQDGVVQDLPGPDVAVTYLYRTLTAETPTTVTGYFGSDDALAVWLNGKKVVSQDVLRGPGVNQASAKLKLAAGENRLLLKIVNRRGGYGYYFSLSRRPRDATRPPDRRDDLWRLVERDFAGAQARRQMRWEREDGIWDADWPAGDFSGLAMRYLKTVPGRNRKLARLAAQVASEAGLQSVREAYYRRSQLDDALASRDGHETAALRRAILDLTETFGPRYPNGREYLSRLAALEERLAGLRGPAQSGDTDAATRFAEAVAALDALRAEALLANPLLDFDRLLVVKRSQRNLGLPANWQGNCALRPNGYDNEIAVLSPVRPGGTLTTLYRPEGGKFVGDVDLHWDADRMLFSSIGTQGRWQILEVRADGTGLRQVTPGEHPDVDNYDPCYLPDGRIIFGSTRVFQGIPCVGGRNKVANLFLMNADGTGIRQLCFDQDHNWCPTVLNDGRVLYTRWEYSDTPHYFSRLLFRMNPDGTGQMAYYGSNSYWPNSLFYARPIPGHPSRVVGIVSGHHGVRRQGELVLFDPARGQKEADGIVQRVPGYGQAVEPIIRDQLVGRSWPRFLHPYALSEKYFLVACRPTQQARWGLYLVDVFDNLLLLREDPEYAFLEPVPFRKTPRPPVIPDKVDPDRKDALVYLSDIYVGEGLAGVPRGTVKALRVYAFHYAYTGMGGHIHVGIDGPWDVHRILGTVPVEEDGSAVFRVPANTPVAVQPLDAEGKALQIMRSWFVGMPGEKVSCVGCHERLSDAPPVRTTLAMRKPPAEVEPWYGPPRGFSFPREVQPVLDAHCVSCHNGKPRPGGRTIPDLSRSSKRGWRGFTPSYVALHPYVRRPGPESDYHIMPPLEYHADTSELVQMLRKGHGGVRLDEEAWDRLITWIDLNVPDHGTWSEHRGIGGDYHRRRMECARLYAGIDLDPEAIPDAPAYEPATATAAAPRVYQAPAEAGPATCPGWPFDADEARRRQAAAATETRRAIDLGGGVSMDLVLVPAGEFLMGSDDGLPDERPRSRVAIDRPFWIGACEVTNRQYGLFDPNHDSRYISHFNKDQSVRGEPANGDAQPVIRISWDRAMAFCRWLSERTGEKFTLPTEAQWEYACRAGTDTALSYGPVETDFGKLANLADAQLDSLTRRDSPDWIPSVGGVKDGAAITCPVGRYPPNAWGLHDVHGNAAEWTRTTFRPYPYDPGDGRDEPGCAGERVVRGGSFYDRPKRCRSAFRLAYPPWQRVYNVGFRLVCEARSAE